MARTIKVRITGETQDLERALSRASGKVDKFGQKAGTSAQRLGGKLSSVGSSMMRTGAIMTGAVTLPFALFAKSSVDAASSLDEAKNKSSVVFGSMAQDVEAWAANSAEAFGLAKAEAFEMAGTFGNLITSMGFSQTEAAGMSKEMVELGSDLASFNNIPIADALEKLRSGLTGEMEPLKALGVSFNDAAVKAKAVELGLAATTAEVDEQDKVMARYKLILEKTTTAQGDFARTSDSLANKQRIAKAKFADLQAELGERFLPIAMRLLEIGERILAWFESLPRGMQDAILMAVTASAALGPLVTIFGGLFKGIGAVISILPKLNAGFLTLLTNPVVLAIAALVALVAAFLYFYHTNEGFRNFMDEKIAAPLLTFFYDILPKFGGALADFGIKVRDTFVKMGRTIWNAVTWLPRKIYEIGRKIIEGLINGIKSMFGSLGNIAKSIGKKILGPFAGILGISSPSKVFEQYGKDTVAGYVAGLQGAAPEVEMAIGQVAPIGGDGASITPLGAAGGQGPMHVTVDVKGATLIDGKVARQLAKELAWQIRTGEVVTGS
jgi:phage-related protein|tara:strand:+ start:1116 stop:2774 length:1659 start_codon:yes stop_codon:yes gene_type:complete